MLYKIRNILERLDYPINYVGQNYISTTALFRSGDNQLALVCYEGNVWDQVEGTAYKWPKFVAMVKGISLTDAELWLGGIEIEDGNEREEKVEKIKVEKVLVESDYEGGVKSYKFFLDRGISKETLDEVGAQLCQGGGFNGRIIFKIRNEKGKLVGVAGRDALNRSASNPNIPRWKLRGSKSDWIYPMFEKNLEAIRRTRQIIIVESVGDCLSLMDVGIYNVLCNFGLSLSAARLSFLLKINPTSIFVALNDDADSLENRGQIAAAKIKLKLSTFFSSDKIINAPPSKGDFGEMNKEEISNWVNKFGVKY
jgi:DNA primase